MLHLTAPDCQCQTEQLRPVMQLNAALNEYVVGAAC